MPFASSRKAVSCEKAEIPCENRRYCSKGSAGFKGLTKNFPKNLTNYFWFSPLQRGQRLWYTTHDKWIRVYVLSPCRCRTETKGWPGIWRKLRWKQVKILRGSATVREERGSRCHWNLLRKRRGFWEGESAWWYSSQETCIDMMVTAASE